MTHPELSRVERKPSFEMAYLFTAEKLPHDAARSKWRYEMDYEPLSIWKRPNQPVLFISAELDEWTPVDQSMINYGKASRHLADTTLVCITGLNHLMSSIAPAKESGIYLDYLDILWDWLQARNYTLPTSR